MNRILLTGCSGFIGSNFLRYIQEYNLSYNILGVDVLPCKFLHSNFHFIQKNVKDLTIEDLSGCTTILHLAARTGVRQSTIEAEDYLQQNVVATQHLLELAVKLKVKRFLFASSSSVYGDSPGQSEDEYPISSTACKSFYAFTKQQCETLTYFYSLKYGITCVALRFFTVYGPSPRTDMLIGKVIATAKQRGQVSFFGNPSTTFRSFTYVDDVLTCILRLLEKENLATWSVWNVGNPNSMSCQSVLSCLEKELKEYGLEFSILYCSQNILDTLETKANITKSLTELNWQPLVSIQEGIYKTVFTEFHSSK